jgi:hypothetical protein
MTALLLRPASPPPSAKTATAKHMFVHQVSGNEEKIGAI